MEENNLVNCIHEINYKMNATDEKLLPNGKKLVRIDFVRGEL